MRLIFVFIVLLTFSMLTKSSYAQAVPDTSLKDPIPEAAYSDTATTYLVTPDTIQNIGRERIEERITIFEPVPKRAGLYAAILPGLGQLYNRQYWKIPIVYAAAGAAGYFIQFNLNNYREYRQAYIARIDSDPNTRDEYEDLYSAQDLRELQDGYKRYLDITVLLSALGYGLQIMDAIASAHLKNFDMSPDISMKMQPVRDPLGTSYGLVVYFK